MIDWTPKQDFINNPTAKKAWASIAESALFRSAINAALLHTMANLPRAQGVEGAAANEYRRHGAQSVLMALMNLHLPFEEPAKRSVSSQNLDHTK
jgi:hypothetical protein